jgi:hypothetical protein
MTLTLWCDENEVLFMGKYPDDRRNFKKALDESEWIDENGMEIVENMAKLILKVYFLGIEIEIFKALFFGSDGWSTYSLGQTMFRCGVIVYWMSKHTNE